jgi:hypothetical protein
MARLPQTISSLSARKRMARIANGEHEQRKSESSTTQVGDFIPAALDGVGFANSIVLQIG